MQYNEEENNRDGTRKEGGRKKRQTLCLASWLQRIAILTSNIILVIYDLRWQSHAFPVSRSSPCIVNASKI